LFRPVSRRLTAAFVLAVAGTAASALPVGAQAATGTFSCRASAARVSTPAPPAPLPLPPGVIEPFVANGGESPCTSEKSDVLEPTEIGPLAKVDAVHAATTASPATPAPAGQGATSTTSVTNPSITLPGLTIRAQVLEATATATCRAGSPQLGSSGRVVTLTINDQTQTIPAQDNMPIPIGPLGTLILNQVDTSQPGTLVRRALYLQTPIATIAIAEAKVATAGTACAAATPGSGVSPVSQTGGRGTARLVVTPRATASRITAGRCVRGAFRATVRGRRISRVVFTLDGRRIRTDSRSPFHVQVPAPAGRHRLRARVTFVPGARTRARLLTLRFARCTPAPRFTG
jgi:hypothetical protein